MRFEILATTIVSATLANAAQFVVKVGANNGLVFDPTSVTAANGDTIAFQFQAKNHSVTQSSFASPCTRLSGGVDSGFQFVNSTAGAANLPEWTINVNNASAPLWFFCAQTTPISHCAQGMVFAVNAPPSKTFTQFQDAAKASGGNSTASASGSSATATGAGTPGAGGSSVGSGSAAPAPSATKSGALKVGSSAAGALTAAALLFSFVL